MPEMALPNTAAAKCKRRSLHGAAQLVAACPLASTGALQVSWEGRGHLGVAGTGIRRISLFRLGAHAARNVLLLRATVILWHCA
jgi:hypothetical protein